MSHYELYLLAMAEAGADTRSIDRFMDKVSTGLSVAAALQAADAPLGPRAFVLADWDVVCGGDPVAVAATFAFGRESLIPEMFTSLRGVSTQYPAETALLLDYLDRHIELDGDIHCPMAMQIVTELCGDDEERWQRAEAAARAALARRIALWDSVRLQWQHGEGGR